MHSNDWGNAPRATYLLLGPPAIRTDTGLRPVRGRLQTTLFSLLVLRPGLPVGSDRLVDALWGDAPPHDAANALQSQVSRLRLALGRKVLRFTGRSYQLDVPASEVDVHVFEQLLAESRQLFEGGAYVLARRTVDDALTLWRGTPFAELPDSEFAELEATRLDELRLHAVVTRLEADLALGRNAGAVSTLRRLTETNPLREDLWVLLVLALYRSGRPADALGAYRAARRTLVRELGIEPGPRLRELEAAVLRHDPDLAAPAHPCAAHAQLLAATPRRLHRLPVPRSLTDDDPPGTLAASPPVQVFLERVRCLVPSYLPTDQEIRDIFTLCRLLDGEPLALELAAAQLPLLSTADLVALHRRAGSAGPADPRRPGERQVDGLAAVQP